MVDAISGIGSSLSIQPNVAPVAQVSAPTATPVPPVPAVTPSGGKVVAPGNLGIATAAYLLQATQDVGSGPPAPDASIVRTASTGVQNLALASLAYSALSG